jgi:peroxiredoxin
MGTILENGEPAPTFNLPGLDGRTHSPEEARGRILVLNFWSAECPWSARGDRELIGYLKTWGERVTAWAIASNANEARNMVEAAAQARGLPLALLDAQGTAADLYGAQATPHFFVVDAEGILRYQGALDDVTFRRREPTQHYLRDAVEALLVGDSPDPEETPAYGCAIVREF